jgi:hypothetical protein
MDRDEKWHYLNDQITAKGYEFHGNVMLPSDSCEEAECCCPACGEGGYWCIWYVDPKDHKREAWAYLCYDCGHMWDDYVDANEPQQEQS